MDAKEKRKDDKANNSRRKESQGQTKVIPFLSGRSKRAVPLYQQSEQFKLGVIAGLYSAEPGGGTDFHLGVEFALGFRQGMSLRYPLKMAAPATQQSTKRKQRRVFRQTSNT
jgi:hypothetical protein